jgi:hypothetical protein
MSPYLYRRLMLEKRARQRQAWTIAAPSSLARRGS